MSSATMLEGKLIDGSMNRARTEREQSASRAQAVTIYTVAQALQQLRRRLNVSLAQEIAWDGRWEDPTWQVVPDRRELQLGVEDEKVREKKENKWNWLTTHYVFLLSRDPKTPLPADADADADALELVLVLALALAFLCGVATKTMLAVVRMVWKFPVEITFCTTQSSMRWQPLVCCWTETQGLGDAYAGGMRYELEVEQ
ncbi:hypothetical protein BGZ60DRAFT_285740 [Tricladium varicosporioides]|nr:hypothetical protein BGZ60DRAFT_285740 [Hymenoscyphus varicosporioides]